MKKLFSITVLLLAFVSISFTQWQVVYVENSAVRFRDICVVNANIIWAVKIATANNICKTTNGGNTWQIFSGINEDVYYISAVSADKAWISTIAGNVYFTLNGGVNWTQQIYQPKKFINYLKFFDENVGFFAADPVNDTVGFFYTRNGGINWLRSPNSPVINYSLALLENCVNALDTNLIWMCASTAPNQFRFYKLTGGFSSVWQVYSYDQTGAVRNAVFKDHDNGLAAGANKILMTTNGGVNWTLRNSSAAGNVVADFLYVPGTNWVILNSASILISRDYCATWQDSSYYSGLYYSDAKDTNSIWIAYTNGRLLKYSYGNFGIIKIGNEIPVNYHLSQNYPNPFNPVTKIQFALPEASDFTIRVFDVAGRELYILKDLKPAGEYEFTFDAANLTSGVYFYRFDAGDFIASKKMILLR